MLGKQHRQVVVIEKAVYTNARRVGGVDKRRGIGLSHVQWMLLAAFARAGATEEKHGQASPKRLSLIRDAFNATLVHATLLKAAQTVMSP